jgi:predicted signal transduction protein with EAL and GGDEF domain
LSISVDAAVFPEDAETYETLLGKADTRMYTDKAARKAAKPRDVRVEATLVTGEDEVAP